MERRDAEPGTENSLLKSGRLGREGAAASQRFELIAAEKESFDVTMMRRLLEVSTSGFHGWPGRPASASQQRRENLKAVIEQVFHDSGRTYGNRRICRELVRQVWSSMTSWCVSWE